MIKDTNKFTTLSEMIAHLSHVPGVVGIVEYGGRTHTDMRPGGDYDLTVIFENPVSDNFTGVYLHVAGIPVDCMLLCLDDFMAPIRKSKNHSQKYYLGVNHEKTRNRAPNYAQVHGR